MFVGWSPVGVQSPLYGSRKRITVQQVTDNPSATASVSAGHDDQDSSMAVADRGGCPPAKEDRRLW